MITAQQVADYYDVPNESVKTCYQRNKTEIDSDDVIQKTSKTITELVGQDVQVIKERYHVGVKLSDSITLRVLNYGIKLFSKRAILRIGVLLRDSEIAKEVRTQLLNVFEKTIESVIVKSTYFNK